MEEIEEMTRKEEKEEEAILSGKGSSNKKTEQVQKEQAQAEEKKRIENEKKKENEERKKREERNSREERRRKEERSSERRGYQRRNNSKSQERRGGKYSPRNDCRRMETEYRRRESPRVDPRRLQNDYSKKDNRRETSRPDSRRMESDIRRREVSRNEYRRENSRIDSRGMENNDRKKESSRDCSKRMENDSRRMESFQETLANTVAEAFTRIGDTGDKGKEPPPVWEKSISFAGWRRSVEVWSDSNLKPAKKANLLLEILKRDSDHSGLKELIIQEVIENEDFDYRKEDVIKDILDKIEAFVEESKWTKNVRLAKELFNFKQEPSEDLLKYVVRFSALEAKLKNEKIQMSNMFKTGILMNQSKMNNLKKSNIMASIDMNAEKEVLEKVEKEDERKLRG